MYLAFFNIYIITNKSTINITKVYITRVSLYVIHIVHNVETCRSVGSV